MFLVTLCTSCSSSCFRLQLPLFLWFSPVSRCPDFLRHVLLGFWWIFEPLFFLIHAPSHVSSFGISGSLLHHHCVFCTVVLLLTYTLHFTARFCPLHPHLWILLPAPLALGFAAHIHTTIYHNFFYSLLLTKIMEFCSCLDNDPEMLLQWIRSDPNNTIDGQGIVQVYLPAEVNALWKFSHANCFMENSKC